MNQAWFWALLSASVLWLLGALAPTWRRATSVSLTLALMASLISAALGAVTWLGNLQWEPVEIGFDLWRGIAATGLPPLHLTFGLDALAAFFIFLVSAFSALVAIYSFPALQAEHFRPYAHWIASAFNLFSWTTVLVITAQDGFSLLIALELMTLSFGYLTLYKHFLYQDKPEHADAGAQRKARLAPQVYLMISHTSTAFLVLAVLILSIHAGGLSFREWMAHAGEMKGMLPHAVFLLALAGLGIRAGLTPAHVWVSLVHPSSPTTTHALSLGIAIKVAIYLMYRFFFQFLAPQDWWGSLLLIVAAVTALVNVWYAISSHDLKEALAYHSIENIGIICAGIGLALIFWRSYPPLASLGLLASLYHLLNHAVFKGLLYLATGAIDQLTHQTVDIERLGGLIHRYRFTSSMFLVGSFAIAGFPPFNGFISEWLTLQVGLRSLSALSAPALDTASIVAFMAVLISLLFLAAAFALTAFCFYKMAGVALLGLPRLPEEERKAWEEQDVPTSMKGVMGLMAALCLALGVLPGLIAPQLARALAPLGVLGDVLAPASWLSFGAARPGIEAATKSQLPMVPLVALALFLTAVVLILPRGFPVNPRRPLTPWNCGEPVRVPPIHQFTGGGLSYSLRRLFALFNLAPTMAPDYLPARFILSASLEYPQQVTEVFRSAYNWLIHVLLASSEKIGHRIQNRDIRSYLWYVFLINFLNILIFWLTSQFLKE